MKFQIIIAGWYFNEYKKFYESIAHLNENIIVASHKKIPQFIKKSFNTHQFDNHGGVPSLYNKVWKFYKNKLLKTDFLIFMHDDTIIKDFTFIEEFHARLKKYHCVGNSQELPLFYELNDIKDLKNYVKGKWLNILMQNNNNNFKFRIVDFRCFAIRTVSLQKLSGFEDLYEGNNLRDTNISLRLFSAKLSYFFGLNSLDTLTNGWLESKYFITDKNDSFKKIKILKFLKNTINKFLKRW